MSDAQALTTLRPSTGTSTGATSQVRVTVLGSARRADVVMPAERPVALLIPSLVDLVGVAGDGACGLYTDDGRAVDSERSLVEAGVPDGVVLRLLSVSAAPPEPCVADLIDEMDRDLRHHAATLDAWLWTVAVTGTSVAVAGAVLVAASPQTVVWVVLISAGGLALALSALGALWSQFPLVWTSGAAALGLVTAGAASVWSPQGAPLVATSALVLSVVGVGALPDVALRAAGVLRMDATISRGTHVSRAEVSRVLGVGHAIMLGGLLTCATTMVVASIAVGLWAADDPWATALLGAALVTWTCRVRHFPGGAPPVVLTATAVVGFLGWSAVWGSQHPSRLVGLGMTCAVMGLAMAVLSSRQFTPVTQAVLRRWVRRAELLCVLTLLPLLLGQAGVYSDLLTSYG